MEELRQIYQGPLLIAADVNKNPFELFTHWMNEALRHEKLPVEPNATVFSTIDQEGFPQSRMVLLKKYDSKGFVFFTHHQSAKGLELEKIPRASLLFFWPRLQRQVRITGWVEKVDRQISESYFASRPRGSQLSAWVSSQSQSIECYEGLLQAFRKFEIKTQNQNLECPPDWGGYQLKPKTFEFWQGQPNRLHTRVKYEHSKEHWVVKQLAP